MTYTKPDQSLFQGLADGELVVQLDSGDLVAVRALGEVEPNTGNAVVKATARAIGPSGEARVDANGQPIATAYSFSADTGTLAALGGIDGFRRCMLLTVMGEPAGWLNPLPDGVLEHASIRTNLASAAASGIAQDLGAII